MTESSNFVRRCRKCGATLNQYHQGELCYLCEASSAATVPNGKHEIARYYGYAREEEASLRRFEERQKAGAILGTATVQRQEWLVGSVTGVRRFNLPVANAAGSISSVRPLGSVGIADMRITRAHPWIELHALGSGYQKLQLQLTRKVAAKLLNSLSDS